VRAMMIGLVPEIHTRSLRWQGVYVGLI